MVSWKSYYSSRFDNVKEHNARNEDKTRFADAVMFEYKIVAYIVVMAIVAMIVIFVIMPMMLITKEGIDEEPGVQKAIPVNDNCRISVLESIPDNLTYPSGSPSFPSTFSAWSDLIDNATQSIDIASFYWTLLGQDIVRDPSDWQGEETFKKLKSAVKDRKVRLRIVMNIPSASSPDNDTIELAQAGAAVRSINFTKLLGNGILHTKLWIIDKTRIYVGSANMDWRSLTQVKELGVILSSCPSLAEDASKLFEVYWYLGKPDTPLPPSWPDALSTKFNKDCPMELKLNETPAQVYFSSSPAQFCPKGRTEDIKAILDVIEKAQKFIYIAVMDYTPMIVFVKDKTFWPVIDDALRRAAIDRGVRVKLLGSKWNHTSPNMIRFLKSLQELNGVNKADIEVKLFVVPAFTEAQGKIPYARVNHNKYMVTDNTAYIGTSNWSGDYFTNTAGIGFIINQTMSGTANVVTVQQQLVSIFERDWNSVYAKPLESVMAVAELKAKL